MTPSPGSNASGSASPSGQAFRWFTQSSDLDLAQGDGQSTNAGEGGGGGGGAGGGKGETDGSGGGGGGLLGVGKNVRGGSKKKKSNGIGGSLSRVFSRGKLRRSLILPHAEAILGGKFYLDSLCLTLLMSRFGANSARSGNMKRIVVST